MQKKFQTLHHSLSARAFADEGECVDVLLRGLRPGSDAVFVRAGAFVNAIRENGGSGIEAFLLTYGLDTREGVAVMCLAEALLRIPDSATADELIHSTFEDTDWAKKLGGSDSFFVNASGWGLLLTGKVVNLGSMTSETPASVLGRLAGRVGEPIVREALKKAMRLMGAHFVLGETIEEALKRARPAQKKGYSFSFDILGEGARSAAQAEAYHKAYLHAVDAIGAAGPYGALMSAPGISVKLSALHPRYQLIKRERVMEELLPRVKEIVSRAMKAGISVSIDAEESTRFDIGLMVYTALLSDPAFKNYDGIGYVLQAYQKRAFYAVDYLAELCRETGKRIPLRLVKGAYWDTEIKLAQAQGLPSYPVFTRKEHTDLSYLACAQKILAQDCFHAQFATHNALTVAAIMEMAQGRAGRFEFQRLHGMGESLHDKIVEDVPCRIYAPVGRHEDLLAYLIRRLLENGANTSFVHHVMDKNEALGDLLQDPVAMVRMRGEHYGAIADPEHLYADRRNSSGVDLGNEAMLATLQGQLHAKHLPEMQDATEAEVEQALARAAAHTAWGAKDVNARAEILESFADRLAGAMAQAVSLIICEADRTLADAVSEVREAIDFCRYYAAHARRLMGADEVLQGPTGEYNALRLVPRGVFACISPWNFPLAIFVGQVAAALVTGNRVIAKPAEQTPCIGLFAVKLMHDAGVPADALQWLVGGGEVGAMLVKDCRVNGVVFTGSLETARHINQALAARVGAIVPFIAETGGQNCMIVDSSALLEQVCDDVVQSAFNSAGQRCSALRVLYVQEEIADKLISLIGGAMHELALGDPFDVATDIGPVIDADAQAKLLAHIAKMKDSGNLLAEATLPPELSERGTFVAPHMFGIKAITELEGEMFGPVLHVIRYKADELEAVCDAINASGYGLTFGLQSRIGEHGKLVQARIAAGNLYVNRNMIGATVGVQPFGGEGLSGTGPKAGGPHYLLRFVTERTVTVNSAAIGGNIELLSKIR